MKRRRRKIREYTTERTRFPWWTSPNLLIVISLLVVLYVILAVGEEQYKHWETPKYVTNVEGVETAGIIIAVLLGAIVGRIIGRRTQQNYLEETRKFLNTRLLTIVFYFFVSLTFIGYGIWIVKAAQSGATTAALLATLQGDPGAISELKGVAQPSAGLTTLTQFGPIVVVLGVARERIAGKGSKIVVALVIALSLLRFFFYAERIAFLEVVVPWVVLLASLWPGKVRFHRTRSAIIGVAPVVMGALVFGLFALGEYFRSWTFVREETGQSFASFITSRFISYYATATNNGVLYGRLAAEHNLNHNIFYMFYNLPGSPFGNDSVAGADFDKWWGLQLELFANPSLTNTGTIFPLIGEISLAPVIVLFFVLALTSSVLYFKAKHGHLISILVVPILCFAALELPRISYLLLGRCVPIFLGIFIVWFLFDIWRALGCGQEIKEPEPPSAAMPNVMQESLPSRYQVAVHPTKTMQRNV